MSFCIGEVLMQPSCRRRPFDTVQSGLEYCVLEGYARGHSIQLHRSMVA